MKLIVYSGSDETIVTTLEKEHEMLKLYFEEGGRDKDEYCREEPEDGYFAITYNTVINFDF